MYKDIKKQYDTMRDYLLPATFAAHGIISLIEHHTESAAYAGLVAVAIPVFFRGMEKVIDLLAASQPEKFDQRPLYITQTFLFASLTAINTTLVIVRLLDLLHL